MEETFYKRVNVKEELPEKGVSVFVSNGFACHIHTTTGVWINSMTGEQMIYLPIWWLKPLPIFSRDKMIENLVGKKVWDLYITKEMAEPLVELLEFSLKSGLPEKKVEIKIVQNGRIYMCPKCKLSAGSAISINHRFCPNCGSKITWI